MKILTKKSFLFLSTLTACILFPGQQVFAKTNLSLKPITYDYGILAGATRTDRAVNIGGYFGGVSGSNAHNNAELGVQAKMLFGPTKNFNPSFNFQALNIFKSANSIFLGSLDMSSPFLSNVIITNNWVLRGIVGLESKPLFKQPVTLGAGVGPAFISQSMSASIAEGTTVTTFNKDQTSLIPSFLVNLTWNVCPSCLNKQGVFVSAQMAADHYSAMNMSGTMSSGNQYTFYVPSHWQISEMIGVSTRL